MSRVQVFSREIVDEVLAVSDIVDIIGASLDMKPAGSGRLKALCPFHNEKTPSFTVSRDRQMFHCFGCGKGGDVIRFLMDHEGLSFREALRRLADRAGVRLPATSAQDDKAEYLRAQLLELGKVAAGHFRQMLEHPMRGSIARQYLKKRALRPETERRFGLGFAPDEWSSLLDAVNKKGFKESAMAACGLFKQGDGGRRYDFFRNRITFPVKDVSGNIVAFGGRDLGDSPAKYINSPETVVYRKSRVLYGLHDARDAMRREKKAILVEGYFDVLRCFDADIENVVASCGTALTPEQAALIRRYVPEVIVVFDGDEAGIRAALKGIGVLIAAGLSVRAMTLPGGQDPDDFVGNEGTEAFRRCVEESEDFVAFYVHMSADRLQTIEGRSEVAQEVFGLLQQIDDELRIDEYLKHTAREIGLNVAACRMEYAKFRRRGAHRTATPKQEPAPASPTSKDDCDFLVALLSQESLLKKAQERLAGMVLEASPLTQVLRGLFRISETGDSIHLESEPAQQLYSAACNSALTENLDVQDLVGKNLNSLEKAALQREAITVQREVQEADRANEFARLGELLARGAKLKRQMEQLGPV